MDIKQHIQNAISEILKNNYQIENLTLEVQQNKTDFEGDFTVVIFPLVKLAKKSPDVLGNELGEELDILICCLQQVHSMEGLFQEE